MVDTTELLLRINKEEYRICFKNLRKYSKSRQKNLHEDKKCSNQFYKKYVTEAGKHLGFNQIYLTRKKLEGGHLYHIGMILQPVKQLGNHNHYDVCRSDQMEEVGTIFDKQIEVFFGEDSSLTSFFYWHPKRIDYAFSIELDSRSILENYIKLFQRTNIPKRFKEPYIMEQHRRGQREGSFYIMINEYVHINFYDKFDQRVKKAIKENEVLVIYKRNIIRFEIQCFPRKVNNIKYSKRFESKMLLNFLDPIIAEEVLLKYYEKTIGFGDYYTYSNAIKLIEKSKFETKIKKEMVELVKLIRQKRNINEAKKEYVDEKNKSEDRFYLLIKKLNDYGINPVTIPKSWKVRDGFLPNPISEIKNNFQSHQCYYSLRDALLEAPFKSKSDCEDSNEESTFEDIYTFSENI